MKVHCNRKSVLEVEFIGEEGTGLGPTLEFYALVAAELQRSDLAMWMHDDDETESNTEIDLGDGAKPNGYYVRHENGLLFPAPLMQDSIICEKVSKYFWFLGVFLAKVLQDGRLVDLPLSKSFLQLISQNKILTGNSLFNLWHEGILTMNNLMEIDLIRAEFLTVLKCVLQEKHDIEQDKNLTDEEKIKKIEKLKIKTKDGSLIKLEDLALTFTYLPSSKVYDCSSIDLIPNGSNVDVNLDNLEEYCQLTINFCLQSGIAKQLDAFQDGFSKVFSLKKMAAFTYEEIRLMICGKFFFFFQNYLKLIFFFIIGEQHPTWTKDDLMNYTEPKLGYSKDSPGFIRFVNVLLSLTGPERKAFLQFTTGCSSLPPGGLANLHPRLTIVRKVDAGEGIIQGYPSVNTCVHYLKLPDYPTEEMLKERLMMATKEKGFHLN